MDAERELLKGNTPTLIMAVLRDGPLHGYAIAREIERRSGEALRFREGTLYPALHALEAQGHVCGEWSQGAGGRARKVYRLTPAGLATLTERARKWERFATAVHAVLGAVPGEESHGPTAEPTPAGGVLQPDLRPAG